MGCAILSLFEGCSDLGCNMNKCQVVAIRCSLEQVDCAIALFPCQLVEFPVRYLDIPLAPMKLPRSALQPLVDQVVDRLPIWKGWLLHHSGCVTLIKTTLSTIMVYTLISLSLPPGCIKPFRELWSPSFGREPTCYKLGNALPHGSKSNAPFS
jgi:hypothetical protein